jgi:hypothetical protein
VFSYAGTPKENGLEFCSTNFLLIYLLGVTVPSAILIERMIRDWGFPSSIPATLSMNPPHPWNLSPSGSKDYAYFLVK